MDSTLSREKNDSYKKKKQQFNTKHALYLHKDLCISCLCQSFAQYVPEKNPEKNPAIVETNCVISYSETGIVNCLMLVKQPRQSVG